MNNTSGDVLAERSRHGRMRVGVVIAGFFTFLQLYTTQPLLPQLRHLFSASPIVVGLTVTAVTTAVALSSPCIGALADLTGRKRVIVTAILALAVPTCLVATSSNLSQLIVWRFAQGLCVPGIIAVTLAYIAEEAMPGAAGSLTAEYVTGTVLGGMSGRLGTALIADHIGWRWAFLLMGMLTAIGGVATWLCLPRSRRFVRQCDPITLLKAMGVHLRNGRLLATFFVGFNCLFTFAGVFTYVNFYLAGAPFHLGLVALGCVFLVYGLGVVITPLAGGLIDRFGYRAGLIAAAHIVMAGALITLIPATWCVILGLAILSSGSFVAQAAAASHVGAAANAARSAAAGLYVSFYYLGGSVGVTMLGVLWTLSGWTACIACVVAVQVLSAILAWRFFASGRAAHSVSPAVAAY